MSVFVTGTDTGVGKTVVSAALLHRYETGRLTAYWKPVATGSVEGSDTETVRSLAPPGTAIYAESYLFEPPVSPHLAARRAGKRIELDRIIERFKALQSETGGSVLVEGIGGVLVPLNERDLVIDMIEQMGIPCLVVSRSTLGTINHTLLTIEALRARKIVIEGVILNGSPNAENRAAIETYGGIEVVAEVPPFPFPLPAGWRDGGMAG